MHVLVTGAGGHLGRKLFDYLTLQPNVTVSGLDIRPVDHPNIYEADFGGEPNWTDYLNDVDVIVHFAGDRAWLEAASAKLFTAVTDGTIDVSINQRFALEDVAKAHDALTGRATTGCTILTV